MENIYPGFQHCDIMTVSSTLLIFAHLGLSRKVSIQYSGLNIHTIFAKRLLRVWDSFVIVLIVQFYEVLQLVHLVCLSRLAIFCCR